MIISRLAPESTAAFRHRAFSVYWVAQLVSYISVIFTLEPGDLIFTGTPPGIGHARQPAIYLKPGDEVEVEIYGVEAAGHGLGSGLHAASIAGGRPGVLHGNRTYLLMDDEGQIKEAHSISAGLDYPGIGPEHAWLNDVKRVQYLSATDEEAVAAFELCSRLEGIIPALEPAHALARIMDLGPRRPREHLMVLNLSGRGDKDLASVAEYVKRRRGEQVH